MIERLQNKPLVWVQFMGETNSSSVLTGYKLSHEMYDYNYLAGGSETSVDESSSPTERHLLDPSGSFTVGQEPKLSASSSRSRKYTPESNTSSLGSDSASSGRTTPTHKGPFNSILRDDDDFESVNRSFGQSTNGQLLICQCPPDAELPGFNRRDFS